MRKRLSLAYLLLSFVSYCDTEVFFSPDDNITQHLLKEIQDAKSRIYAAVYMLTDKKIAIALANAKKRGVDVQIVTDRISAESAYGKCETLAENQIPVFLFEPPANSKIKDKNPENEKEPELWESEAIMHNKFVVIDEKLLTGSFNWTVKANKKNEENLLLTREKNVVETYRKRFDLLKERSKRFTLAIPESENAFQRVPA